MRASRSDMGLVKLVIGISLINLCGIVALLSLTANQDFDCGVSSKAPVKETAHSVENADGKVQGSFEPTLPGIMPGKTKPRLVFAAEPTWAPYAYINHQTGAMVGFGKDMAEGMGELCGFDVVITETRWTECWGNQTVGRGLLNGHYHGCMTYTHSKGSRDRQMDFSHAFLKDHKQAGLLVRLKDDGTPEIDGNHTLQGKKIVRVNGWAPTADGLAFALNSCTGERFAGYSIVPSSTQLPNDDALGKLLDGTADAMWVYVDQGENYKNAGCIVHDPVKRSTSLDWDCAKWAGFGKKFAFVQTGQLGHAINGTTLAVSKKGSSLNNIINPCMDRFMQTEEYYKVCSKHGLTQVCYPNAFFPKQYLTTSTPAWEIRTKDLETQCSDGYCPCPV